MKYISITALVISFLIGIIFMYLSKPELKTIHISPNPDNCKKNKYQDKAGNCFTYEAKEVSCNNEVIAAKVEI